MNNPLAGTDPTGYCGTGSRLGGSGGMQCRTVSFGKGRDKGKAGAKPEESSGTELNNGAQVQQGVSKKGSELKDKSTTVEQDSSSADSRSLTVSTDDAQFHWDGKHTDGPKTTKTTTEYETDVEFEGTLETLRATKYELQTTPSANLPDFTKTGGLPVGPGIDVAIDWNNYDVTFQVYSLYEVTTTQTSWSRETVAISSITGQKIKYHSKVLSPSIVVRTSLGRYWTIKGKTGQKVGTMKFPLPVQIPTR